MKQPDKKAREEYRAVVFDAPEAVAVPGTSRIVKVRGIRPYTLERLTRLWGERDMRLPGDSAETLKEECRDPYFSVKCACIIALNSYWGLRFVYPFMWRIWAYLRGYTEEQMQPIIAAGKKKLPLVPYWENMVYLTDMRTDWMKMTAKEAEAFRAEQISAANALSSRSTPPTESRVGVSDAGSGTGDTDAF